MLPLQESVTLVRKRYIPNEVNILKKDIILHYSTDMIVTKWDTLKPRADFTCGYSIYFLNEGFKVSKLLTADGSLLHYYCDIVNTEIHFDKNEIIFTDLLLDVVIDKKGAYKILDMDELTKAYRDGIIDEHILLTSLDKLNKLLEVIYSNKFNEIICTLNSYIQKTDVSEIR